MKKIVFDSALLPGNDRLRKEAWIEAHASAVARLTIDPVPDAEFAGRLEIVPLNGGSIGDLTVVADRVLHTKADIAADGLDTVMLMLNAGAMPLRMSQSSKEVDLAPGEAVLFDQAEPAGASAATLAVSRAICIQMPRNLLHRQLADFEDRFMLSVPARSAALSLMRSYCDALLANVGALDAHLASLAISHIAELVAAAVGRFVTAATEQSLGQRAAHLIMIRREIDRNFGDPGFSLTALSRRLGVTPRHVQRLLAESQTSFVDELIERRLRWACAVLTSPRHGHTSILDIAHDCGFSTVSHFHRLFRRRFGMTPGDMRAQLR